MDSVLDELVRMKYDKAHHNPFFSRLFSFCRCRQSPQGKFHMAIASYKEDYSNEIKIIRLKSTDPRFTKGTISSESLPEFQSVCTFDHPYPDISGTGLTIFEIGAYVLVAHKTEDGRSADKLAPRWRGPYVITHRQICS
jgi:hypothetical protein